MIFVPLGNTDDIGASCHYLNIEGTGIILDAGHDPDDDSPEGLPWFDIIDRHPEWPIDHAIISHGHHDHIGALPVLIQQFPHVLAHMTRATRMVVDFVLPGSARLQRRRLQEGSSVHDPLFSEAELETYSYLYLTHELEQPFNVSGYHAGAKVTATFFDAGHVLGSVGTLLEVEGNNGNRRIFFTGDTHPRPQLIIPGAKYPDGPLDLLIMEGTLGADPDAERMIRTEEQERFQQAINATLDRGGTILVPVFSFGRSQETLAMIDAFKRHGRLDPDVPVYTTGGLRGISDLYDRTRSFTPRVDSEFEVYSVDQRRFPRRAAAAAEALREPSIHLCGSGMMFENTLSNKIAQELIAEERNSVFLVGFAKEDSPADLLHRARREGKGMEVVLDRLRGPQPVMCDVERFRFSGHAHRRDLIQLVESMQPKKVVIVHAETDARDWLADNIRYFYPDVEIITPRQGEPLEI